LLAYLDQKEKSYKKDLSSLTAVRDDNHEWIISDLKYPFLGVRQTGGSSDLNLPHINCFPYNYV
jgi:hypothetical protein